MQDHPANETGFGFTEEQHEVLGGLNRGFGTLSVLGGVFVIFCYIKFRPLRSFAFKMVFYMACANLIESFANIMGNVGNHTELCGLQAVLISYFALSSLLWAFLIAFTLHKAFLLSDPAYASANISARHRNFCLLGFGYPLIATILPAFTSSYGPAGGWCWIKPASKWDHFWRFTQFYIPLWFIMVYCGVIYYRVARKIAAMRGPDLVTGRLKLYPLVLVCCFFWASVNRIFEALAGHDVFFLACLQVIGTASVGFANAVVYGLTDQVRVAVKALWDPEASAVQHNLMESDEEEQQALADNV